LVVPGWMTEPWAATLPEVNIPRLSLAALEELRGIVKINHVLPFSSSKMNQNGEDDGTASGTPATRPCCSRFPRRRRAKIDEIGPTRDIMEP
jgi:hypothetical protein